MLEAVQVFISQINHFLWLLPLPVLALSAGFYFSMRLGFLPQRHVLRGLNYLLAAPGTKGGISPYRGLMTAMASTVGTGNVAGIATAITLGGPGALFYIWCMGFFVLGVKFVETLCAVRFQKQQGDERFGGPMYYMQRLGPWWRSVIAPLYVFCLCGAGLGIGSMVQANSVAQAAEVFLGLPTWLTGLLMMLLALAAVLGGIARISLWLVYIVPFMVMLYVSAAMVVVVTHYEHIASVLSLVIHAACWGQDATAAFSGASVWAAMHYGFSRCIFANEVGMGSAAIAHGAVQTEQPIRQAFIGLLGTFIDTFMVCTLSALVILLHGSWQSGQTGSIVMLNTMHDIFGPWGAGVIFVSLTLFAFSTVLSWGYYTQAALLAFCQPFVLIIYRAIWLIALPLGASVELLLVWEFADLFNGLMLFFNVIALVFLSGSRVASGE